MDIEEQIYRDGVIRLVAATLSERVPLVDAHLNEGCEWDDGQDGESMRCITHGVTLMPAFADATAAERARIVAGMGGAMIALLETAEQVIAVNRMKN